MEVYRKHFTSLDNCLDSWDEMESKDYRARIRRVDPRVRLHGGIYAAGQKVSLLDLFLFFFLTLRMCRLVRDPSESQTRRDLFKKSVDVPALLATLTEASTTEVTETHATATEPQSVEGMSIWEWVNWVIFVHS
jgi:hypothetical protein